MLPELPKWATRISSTVLDRAQRCLDRGGRCEIHLGRLDGLARFVGYLEEYAEVNHVDAGHWEPEGHPGHDYTWTYSYDYSLGGGCGPATSREEAREALNGRGRTIEWSWSSDVDVEEQLSLF